MKQPPDTTPSAGFFLLNDPATILRRIYDVWRACRRHEKAGLTPAQVGWIFYHELTRTFKTQSDLDDQLSAADTQRIYPDDEESGITRVVARL